MPFEVSAYKISYRSKMNFIETVLLMRKGLFLGGEVIIPKLFPLSYLF